MGWVCCGFRMGRTGFKAESHHVRWEGIFSLHGQHGKWYRAKKKGLLGAEGRLEREEGIMGMQCSIPRRASPPGGVRSVGVLRGQLMERGGWRSRPALRSSLLRQPDLPLAASFSHLGAICPPLPAGGQRPSSHEQPCQICSPRPAQPRLGKSGPKYHAMSRCSLWVPAHPQYRRPGSISTDPCAAR